MRLLLKVLGALLLLIIGVAGGILVAGGQSTKTVEVERRIEVPVDRAVEKRSTPYACQTALELAKDREESLTESWGEAESVYNGDLSVRLYEERADARRKEQATSRFSFDLAKAACLTNVEPSKSLFGKGTK